MYVHTITGDNGFIYVEKEIDDQWAMDIVEEAQVWLDVQELPDGDYTWREGSGDDWVTHTMIKK